MNFKLLVDLQMWMKTPCSIAKKLGLRLKIMQLLKCAIREAITCSHSSHSLPPPSLPLCWLLLSLEQSTKFEHVVQSHFHSNLNVHLKDISELGPLSYLMVNLFPQKHETRIIVGSWILFLQQITTTNIWIVLGNRHALVKYKSKSTTMIDLHVSKWHRTIAQDSYASKALDNTHSSFWLRACKNQSRYFDLNIRHGHGSMMLDDDYWHVR